MSRLYVYLVVTYLITLVLPLISGMALQSRTEAVLRDEVIAGIRGILKQFEITMEGELENLSQKTAQISQTPRVRSLRAKLGIESPLDQYEVLEASNTLRTALSTSRLVKRSYLFLQNIDYIISDAFASDRRHFFELESDAGAIGYEAWERLLGGEHRGTLVPISEQSLYFIQSLIGSTGRDQDTSICYLLDRSMVRDLITSSGWIKGGSLFVVDHEGRIIVSREEGVHELPLAIDAIARFPAVIERESPGTIIIHESSGKYGLEYVFVLPTTAILGKVGYVRRYALFLFALTVVLGVIGGGFFAYLQYSPVKKLLQLVSRNRSQQDESGDGSAYAVIQRALGSAFENETRYRELSTRQLDELRDSFLYRMLSSFDMDASTREEGLRSYNIALPHGCFGIILAIVEDETVESIESADPAGSQPFRLDSVAEGVELRLLRPSHIFIILANFDRALWNVRSVAMRIRTICEQRLGCSVTIAVSSEKESVHELPRAYHEAMQALEYRDLLGPGELIDYCRIHPSRVLFTYSLEDEVRLITLVRSGDEARATDMVDGMLRSSAGWDKMTSERRSLLKYNLVGTLARLAGGPDGSSDGGGGATTDSILTSILTCESLDDLRSLLSDAVRDLCSRYGPADLTTRHRELVENIRSYVSENYGNPNLNIAHLGEVFRLTPYYVSRIFRETHGISLLEYIGRQRVERATSLLRESEMSIGAIARSVGYESSNTFIRIFKSFEGMTPGAYRTCGKR